MAENRNAQQVREITEKLEPVSYTQLDVYKRQSLQSPQEKSSKQAL